MRNKIIAGAAALGLAAVASLALTGSATAANTVDSSDIVNGSVRGIDVASQTLSSWDIAEGGVGTSELRNDTVAMEDLTPGVRAKLEGPADTGFEADGPYPGATDLGDLPNQGDNSDAKVPADGDVHQVWVQCAPGKVAIGGGFRVAADSTVAAAKAIHVVASEPTQIKDGAVAYEPIEGDAAGSFVPNGWLVEVVNDGDSEQIVRPWVTCVKS